MSTPTIEQLQRAIIVSEKIQALEAELHQILNGASPAPTPSPSKPKPAARGGLSAAGRARIIAGQRKRWAKIKAGKKAPPKRAATPKAPVKKKGGITPAGRKKLAAAMRARWAAAKAGKGPAPTAS